MLYNTVSTLGMSRRVQSTMTELQIELMRANEEAATLVHADVSATLGARTGRDISLRNLFDRTEEHIKTADLLEGRMATMDSAMTSIYDAVTGLLATATTGLGQQAPIGSSLQIQARGVLEQVVGLLNATVGNEYVFAGTLTGTAPMREVDAEDPPLRSPMQIVQDAIDAATGGGPPGTAAETTAVIAMLDDLFAVRDPAIPATPPLTDTYEGGLYSGTTAMQAGGAASPRISGRPAEDTIIPYGVQANDPMFREMMQGIYMLAALDSSKLENVAYTDYIATAVDKMAVGLGQLRDATAQLGIQSNHVSSIAEQHRTQIAILNTQIGNMESVDPYTAQVRISQLETQIDATAGATARLAKLRLTNYL